MVVCGALVVPPASSVYTPQDLSNRLVGLDFGNGRAYAGLQMLEGAVPREAIKTCSFDANPAKRYAALMAGKPESSIGSLQHRRSRAHGVDHAVHSIDPVECLGIDRLRGTVSVREYVVSAPFRKPIRSNGGCGY